ncbi:MAG: hypothetical protein U0527_06740 [Candidatus Eisenbacteria bacterium]
MNKLAASALAAGQYFPGRRRMGAPTFEPLAGYQNCPRRRWRGEPRTCVTSWRRRRTVRSAPTNKPFLEVAPHLIAIFTQTLGVKPDGRSTFKTYYAQEIDRHPGRLPHRRAAPRGARDPHAHTESDGVSE